VPSGNRLALLSVSVWTDAGTLLKLKGSVKARLGKRSGSVRQDESEHDLD